MPPAPETPSAPGAPSADESAMAAAMAAGPQHGAKHLHKMTKSAHNMPTYGPATDATQQ